MDSEKAYTIEDVRVGNTKESMDMIGDFTLLIADVSVTFGRHIKYHVRSETSSTATQTPTPGPRNAFENSPSDQAPTSSNREKQARSAI